MTDLKRRSVDDSADFYRVKKTKGKSSKESGGNGFPPKKKVAKGAKK